MKLYELWTVTEEQTDDNGQLTAKGKLSPESEEKTYYVIKDTRTNKGQWEIVEATARTNK